MWKHAKQHPRATNCDRLRISLLALLVSLSHLIDLVQIGLLRDVSCFGGFGSSGRSARLSRVVGVLILFRSWLFGILLLSVVIVFLDFVVAVDWNRLFGSSLLLGSCGVVSVAIAINLIITG